MKRRPQWDDSLADRSQYRLTYAEQLQRKAAMVSKNKEAGREELQKRQDMLKQGKIPDEIKKTIHAPQRASSKSSKVLKKSPSTVSAPPQPAPALKPHFAELKKTQKVQLEDHLSSISKLDQAMKDLEEAMLKAASSENEMPKAAISKEITSDFKETSKIIKDTNKEDTISEESLFGVSDDDDLAYSKISDASKYSKRKNDIKPAEEFNDIGYDHFLYGAHLSEKNFQSEPGKQHRPFELELTGKFNEAAPYEDEIQYDRSWLNNPGIETLLNNEDPDMHYLKMIEATRQDLNHMKIIETPETNFEEPIPAKQDFIYDEDVMPQQFNLVPLERPLIPRTAMNSLSIFDHTRTVKIQSNRFII